MHRDSLSLNPNYRITAIDVCHVLQLVRSRSSCGPTSGPVQALLPDNVWIAAAAQALLQYTFVIFFTIVCCRSLHLLLYECVVLQPSLGCSTTQWHCLLGRWLLYLFFCLTMVVAGSLTGNLSMLPVAMCRVSLQHSWLTILCTRVSHLTCHLFCPSI